MKTKIRRNDNCPCGSGLKYKRCCSENGRTLLDDDYKKIDISLNHIYNTSKIDIKDENGHYRIFWDDNVENVNPIEYYKNFELKRRVITYRDLLEMKEPILSKKLSDDFYINFAKERIKSEKFWESREQTEIPENFLKLLETTKKTDQKTLLKGLSINPKQLIALIFKSFKEFGFLYSRYRFENLPKSTEDKKKPKLAIISEDGMIKTIGDTNLTKGQIKNMIEQRKVIIAHFLHKDNTWHCLFTTDNSLGGKENWKDGQPHFHYISSFFGVTKEDFIESIKCGQYKSTSIHIDLLEYGNEIKNEKKR